MARVGMVYLAAGVFTQAERQWNSALAAQLRERGYVVFVPHEESLGQPYSAEGIFDANVEAIENAGVVVAILDGSDPGSGTSWECGYAFAREIPVIAVRTDFRGGGDEGEPGVNLMLSQGAVAFVSTPALSFSFAETVDAIAVALASEPSGQPPGS